MFFYFYACPMYSPVGSLVVEPATLTNILGYYIQKSSDLSAARLVSIVFEFEGLLEAEGHLLIGSIPDNPTR